MIGLNVKAHKVKTQHVNCKISITSNPTAVYHSGIIHLMSSSSTVLDRPGILLEDDVTDGEITPSDLDDIFGIEFFPEKVFIIEANKTQWVMYHHKRQEAYGLVCFSTKERAADHMKMLAAPNLTWELFEKTRDEALEIAKGLPLPVNCVILLDDMNKPTLQFVR